MPLSEQSLSAFSNRSISALMSSRLMASIVLLLADQDREKPMSLVNEIIALLEAEEHLGLQPGRRNSGQSEPQMHIRGEGDPFRRLTANSPGVANRDRAAIEAIHPHASTKSTRSTSTPASVAATSAKR
jgi:hypothetical protein